MHLVKWAERESDQTPLYNVEITSGAIVLNLYMNVLSIKIGDLVRSYAGLFKVLNI